MLLESSLGHDAVIGWLSVLVDSSVAAGLLGTTVARATVTSSNPIAVQMSLQNKLTELRATYASMPDELSGRRRPALPSPSHTLPRAPCPPASPPPLTSPPRAGCRSPTCSSCRS